MREKRTRWAGVLTAHNFGTRSGQLRSHEMLGVLLLFWLVGSVSLAIGVGRSIAWGKDGARLRPRRLSRRRAAS